MTTSQMSSQTNTTFGNTLQNVLAWGLAIIGIMTIGYWGGDINGTGNLFYLGLAVLSLLILSFGALTWWLFFSPLPAGTKPPVVKPASVLHQTIGLLALLGGFMLLIGIFWDETWHRAYGTGAAVNDFLWRPHLMIYGSMALTNLFAIVGLRYAIRGQGDIRRRFRSEPLLGILGLMSAYCAFSGPSDLIWHKIYGVDITAWSLPHLFLVTGVALVLLTAVALNMSQLPKTEWRFLGDLRLPEILAIILIAIATLATLEIGVSEWDGLQAVGGSLLNGSSHAQFWLRPEWFYPVVIAAISLFFSAFTLSALRRAGSATLTMLLVVAIRVGLLLLLGAWNSKLGAGLHSHLLMLPGAIALDVWYALRLKQPDTPLNRLLGSLVGAVVSVAVSLLVIPSLIVYPRINASTAPAMILFGLIFGVWAGWVGTHLGEWLGGMGRPVGEPQALPRRAIQLSVGALVGLVAFAVFFILTATPPAALQ